MARTSIDLNTTQEHAWAQLQYLETWEGVAGIEDLSDAEHDAAGNLAAFRFAVDTALGRVGGRATAAAKKPGMTIRGAAKGLEITLSVVLIAAVNASKATVDASARSTSFLSTPLAMTLNALLDNSIDGEAEKIARRINQRA